MTEEQEDRIINAIYDSAPTFHFGGTSKDYTWHAIYLTVGMLVCSFLFGLFFPWIDSLNL